MNALIIIGTAFLLFLIFAGTTYVLALMGIDTWIAFVWTGEVKFVVAGQTVIKVLINVPGYRYDKETKTIVKLTEGEKPTKFRWYTKRFGIFLIPLYPFEKIYTYKFECDVMETKTEGGKMVQKPKHVVYEKASSLYWKFIYPVEADEVDLEGNITIRVLVQVTYQVINPIHLIFILDGQWAERAKEVVQGLIAGYARNKEFNTFREQATQNSVDPKTPSLGQFLTGKYLLSTEEIKPGEEITKPGITIVEARLIEFGYAGRTTKIQEAIVAEDLAKRNANAAVATADGERRSIILKAEGEAKRRELIGAAEGKAIAAELAGAGGDSGLVQTKYWAKAIADAKPSTLVGGGPIMPTLQIPSTPTKKETTEKKEGDQS